MKLIENWRSFWRLYSVWCFIALIVVSVADVLLSLYTPQNVVQAVLTGIGSAVLAVAGIFLRVVKQEPKSDDKNQTK